MDVAQAIAIATQAAHNCADTNNEWLDRWHDRLNYIERNCLPSGSGFDSGTTIDREASNDSRIVLNTSFHHMDDVGYYDGWSEHKVTIRGKITGWYIASISGRDRNGIKDYIADTLHSYLSQTIEWDAMT